MPKKRKSWLLIDLVGSMVVAIVVAGVAFTTLIINIRPPEPAVSQPAAVPTPGGLPQATLLLGVPAPANTSDKLFKLTIPAGKPVAQTVAAGWRIAALTDTGLHIDPASSTDEGLFLNGPDGWHVPLRRHDGVPYGFPSLLGMFDKTHAAVSAVVAGDLEAILAVSRAGEVRAVYGLPVESADLGMQAGAVWVSTFMPGEGIESAPQGPSSLIRIDANGSTSTVATDNNVIVDVVADPSGSIAYHLDSGNVVVTSPLSWQGVGRPLLWLDKNNLVYAKGTDVSVVTFPGATSTLIGTLSAEPHVAVLAPVNAGM